MAPTKPSKRTSVRAKAVARASSSATEPSVAPTPYPVVSTSSMMLQPTKKEKLKVRHATLISKIKASNLGAISKSSKKNLKRKINRESKQGLIAGLESLADALPDTTNDILNEKGKDAIASIQGSGSVYGKAKMKSIKSKPGVQRKKDKIVKEECERFTKNLAIMQSAVVAQRAAVGKTVDQPEKQASSASSWAALRGFIRQTLDKKEEFVQNKVTS